MPIRLLNSWLVIKDLEPDEVKIGNIYIPDGSVDTPYKWATVLETGRGKSIDSGNGWAEVDVKKGDVVLYVRFLKKTDTGKALTGILEREYGSGAFLIQEKDVICCKSTKQESGPNS
jgi:co-chaperonin GroES (HSP10)